MELGPVGDSQDGGRRHKHHEGAPVRYGKPMNRYDVTPRLRPVEADCYRVSVRTPDDPGGWTAIGEQPVGERYQYTSGDVAVIVDFGERAEVMLSSAEEAIAYALMETEHIPGFISRAAEFHDRLLEAGYVVVEE